ncbi:glycosyltransferase [Ornithinimicrobium sp. INDO-MA30-4]|nr:glycosyltransferase [Ornithinimicrobium sp. INDO-MA30-4]
MQRVFVEDSVRVGLVSPYAIDVPGGVQQHVLELAHWLRGHGHQVSVLAPADDESALPEGVTSAGGTVSVRYNGSVARLAFGPLASARTRRWVTGVALMSCTSTNPLAPACPCWHSGR